MKTKKLLILLSLLALLATALPTAAQDDSGFTYYVTDDAAYAAVLLDGWVAQGNREDGLWMVSSEDTMTIMLGNDTDVSIPSGEYAILAFAGPIENVDEWDPMAFLTEVVAAVADPELDSDISEAYEMEFQGRTFARIDASNSFTDAIALVYEIAPQTWGFGVLYAAPGERDATSEDGLALLNTVAYSLPLEDTVEGAFGTDYLVPAGWVGNEFEGIFTTANTDEALDAPDDLDSGQFKLAFFEWDGADVEDTAATILEGTLTEDLHTNDPIWLTVGDQEVLQIAVRDEDEAGVGGIMVMDGPKDEPDLVAIYQSAPGESHLIGLTALNMLLNGQVTVETD